MEFQIKLAEIPVRVHSQYDTLKEYCRDYLISDQDEVILDEMAQDKATQVKAPDEDVIEVRITQQDIEREREDADTESNYSSEYLETLALLRLTADQMADRDCFLMHGAVISYHGGAYMFTAPSGTGKSTHISLWRQYLGDEVEIINGDKPFITVSSSEVRAYGTPWAGKERWQTNTSGELKGICVLEQGKENKIRRLSPGEAAVSLLRQIHFTDNAEHAGRIMELADQMIRRVPVWHLTCDISEEAVRTSREAMEGLRR